jgi:hypothetical protein
MCPLFDALNWHGHCSVEGAPGGIRRTWVAHAAYRHVVSEIPPSAPGTTSAGEATMAKNHGKISRESVARATEISEIAIVWGAIIAVIVVMIGMIKSMFG